MWPAACAPLRPEWNTSQIGCYFKDGRLHAPSACSASLLPCRHRSETSLAVLGAGSRVQPRSALFGSSPALALLCSRLSVRLCPARHSARVRRAVRAFLDAPRRRRGRAGPERAQGGAHGGQGGRVWARHGIGQDPVLCRGAGVRPVQGAPTPPLPCLRGRRCSAPGAGAAPRPARPPQPWRSRPPAGRGRPAPAPPAAAGRPAACAAPVLLCAAGRPVAC